MRNPTSLRGPTAYFVAAWCAGANRKASRASVKQRATAQLDSQKGRATDSISTIAHAVRGTTSQLRNEQHDVLAQYVEKAADQLERFSANLRDKDMTELLNGARSFARRQPALFVGGSLVAGLLAARFLKRFVPDNIPWAHIDLSAATRRGGLAHVPTEITGFGARLALTLLLDHLKHS